MKKLLADATGDEREGTDPWPENAKHWRHIGPPLRPSAPDIGFYADALLELVGHRRRPRALLLGVTPEIFRLPWPEGTDFLAVDRTQAMIDAVWPGPKKLVQCADWLSMSLPDGSRDIVLCDGGLSMLSLREQRRLVRMLYSVLSDRGLCIFRLFVPPLRREHPDAVLHDLLAGRISNLNILKLRLGMSVSESSETGVELRKVWSIFDRAVPDPMGLAGKLGWPVEHMLAIDAYRDSPTRYYFVTLDEVCAIFSGNPGGFQVQSVRVPPYEFGAQCPTIVMRRTASGTASADK